MSTRPVPKSTIPLLAAAMAIFLITVVIGILNGIDAVQFDHGPLMAHVHAGTLGWITLSVFAGAAWVLGAEKVPSGLVWTAIIAVALYIVAFYLSLNDVRPYTGTLMLAVVIWFTVWAFLVRRGKPLTVTSFGMLLATINLTIGGLLGVLLGLMLAGVVSMPEGISGAHPAMMVAGYLVLAGVSLAEQLLATKGSEATSKPGIAQQLLLFLAGILLAIGLLLDVMPILAMNLLFQIAGVVFVVARMWKYLKGWGSASPARFGAMAVVFLVPATALIVYVIVRFSEDFEAAPPGVFIALDHLTFVGVLTNVIFGMLLLATAARREVMSWADQLIFWGLNLGLLAFTVGLLAENVMLKRLGTPVMGTAILLGLLTYAMRLSGSGTASAADVSQHQA